MRASSGITKILSGIIVHKQRKMNLASNKQFEAFWFRNSNCPPYNIIRTTRNKLHFDWVLTKKGFVSAIDSSGGLRGSTRSMAKYALVSAASLEAPGLGQLLMSHDAIPVPIELNGFCDAVHITSEILTEDCQEDVLKKLDVILRSPHYMGKARAVVVQALLLVMVHKIRTYPAHIRSQRRLILGYWQRWLQEEANLRLECDSFFDLALDADTYVQWAMFG